MNNDQMQMIQTSDKFLAEFDKVQVIEEVLAEVHGELHELTVGDTAFTYGNGELSASTSDGSLFIWEVNSYGDNHSYTLVDWEMDEA